MGRKRRIGNEVGTIDLDRTTFMWNIIYKKVYANSLIGNLFDLNHINKHRCLLKSSDKIGLQSDKIKTFVEKYHSIFSLSGDADFGRIGGLKDYVYSKEINVNSYEEYIYHMHQFYNFSLCPVNAGMNMKKGLKYKDCFPMYLYKLKEYYKKETKDKKLYIIQELANPTYGGAPSKRYTLQDKEKSFFIDVEALQEYLNLFETFDNYCRQVFFFGYNDNVYNQKINECINELLEFGEKIDCPECCDKERYLKNALEYWRIKYEVALYLLSKEEGVMK